MEDFGTEYSSLAYLTRLKGEVAARPASHKTPLA